MFRIQTEPISPMPMEHDGAGGFVTFEGKVRNRNDGQPVLRLEYEAYAPMAESEGEKILNEAKSVFGLLEVKACHRVGVLEIGETAVWIGVASPHRGDAFRACAFVIDEIKRRVPIWKKEHYVSGPSEWIGCHQSDLVDSSHELYRRQTVLPEVGADGQAKLSAAKVLVVGAGGLGSASLPYLAAAGIGTIGICDGDQVELSNLHRQVLYAYGDNGLPKASVAATRLRRQNPYISVVEINNHLTAENGEELVGEFDVILDGTDNFATKFLLNDLCVRLGRPLIQASLHQFEGQIMVVDPASNGGCLRCIWPEAPYDGCVGTCAEAGVLGILPGAFGVLQANEVIKVILGMEGVLHSELLTLDLRNYETNRIRRKKYQNCPNCGNGHATTDCLDLTAAEAFTNGYALLDIREPEEWEPIPILPGHRIPLSKPAELRQFVGENQPCVLVCQRGMRSAALVRELRGFGIEVYSLIGGISSL
ncbi:MAG: ThiF family adenylyltransferase [Fimbriimonadaceae bacterium]